MASASPLPDPVVYQWEPNCFDCGYLLAGLSSPGECPECGGRFEERLLVLCGIRHQTVRNPLRIVLWAVLGVLVYFCAPLVIWLLFDWPVVCALIGLALAAAFAAMLRSGRGEQRGTERFIFSPGKIVCARLDAVAGRRWEDDAVVIELPSGCRIDWKRAGPFWRMLKIRADQRGGTGRVVLRAGVRCTDVLAPRVEAALRAAAGQE